MQIVSPTSNRTYSQSLMAQLATQQIKRDMKKLSVAVLILNVLFTIALFLSFNALPYALFLLVQIITTGGITLYAIRFNKVTQNIHRIQRIIVFMFTLIQSVFTLALCIFAIAVSSKAPTIIGVIFEMVLPGLIVILLKLYFIFFKKRFDKKKAEEQMKVQTNVNYSYHEIGDSNSKL